jgi:hypothetical protein
MSEYFDGALGATVSDYEKRKCHFIRIFCGRVSTVASLSIDVDEIIESPVFIVDQPHDGLWGMRWELEQRIEKRVGRILDIEELARIDAYVDRVAS